MAFKNSSVCGVHVMDLELGGSAAQAWALGVVSVLLVAAFALRLRQLGYVLGAVGTATCPALARFVRQKTIRLITFRKDGTPGSSPPGPCPPRTWPAGTRWAICA